MSYDNSSSSIVPGGRLTLASAVPVMTYSIVGATIIYYTPAIHQSVPLFDGLKFKTFDFGGELSQTLSDATKSPAAAIANTNYDMFVWDDNNTIRCTRGAAWSSNNVRGAPADLTILNGVYVNNAAIANGAAQYRGTYVGTIRTNAGATVDFIFGSSGSGGVAASLNVWNKYNKSNLSSYIYDNGVPYTYSSATVRQARASNGNQVNFLVGLTEDAFSAYYQQNIQTTANAGAYSLAGIGLDSTTVFTAGNQAVAPSANALKTSILNYWTAYAGEGSHFIAAIEQGDGTHANSFDVFGGAMLLFNFLM